MPKSTHTKLNPYYFVLCLAIAAWISIIIYRLPDRWEDSYSYLLSLQDSLNEGRFDSFWFSRDVHHLYTRLLYIFGQLIGNAYVAAKSISILCYSITLLSLYRLSSSQFNRKTAQISLLFCTIISVDYSQHGLALLSGTLFTAILVSGFYCYLCKRFILAYILFGTLFLIRSEASIVFAAIMLLQFIQKRYKLIFKQLLVSLPFLLAWALLDLSYYLATKSNTANNLSERFGDQHFIDTLLDSFINFSHALFGGSVINCIICIVLIFILFSIFVFTIPNRHVFNKYTHLVNQPIFSIAIFTVFNFCLLVILKHLRLHPLSVRHFAYLVPFIAITIAFSITTIEQQSDKIIKSLSRYSVISLFCVSILIVPNVISTPTINADRHISLSSNGRFFYLSNMMVGQIQSGTWLSDKLGPGERIISVLPSVAYYSHYTSAQIDLNFPDNLLDLNSYKNRRIKYVAWTTMPATQNADARRQLAPLQESHDFLFFRHKFTPLKNYGHFVSIYSVDENLMTQLAANIDKGWYGKEAFGRWASSAECTIEIHSTKKQNVLMTFSVGSFVRPALMKIWIGDSQFKTVDVHVKDGNNTTPTPVSLQFFVDKGVNTIRFVGPDEFFVPFDLGRWDDHRKLRLAFGNMVINGVQLF